MGATVWPPFPLRLDNGLRLRGVGCRSCPTRRRVERTLRIRVESCRSSREYESAHHDAKPPPTHREQRTAESQRRQPSGTTRVSKRERRPNERNREEQARVVNSNRSSCCLSRGGTSAPVTERHSSGEYGAHRERRRQSKWKNQPVKQNLRAPCSARS